MSAFDKLSERPISVNCGADRCRHFCMENRTSAFGIR